LLGGQANPVSFRPRHIGPIESGDIRKDLDAFDLLRALIGVSNIAIGPDWKESARRLADILIKGQGGSDGYGWR